jgi:hypothetical protein
MTDEIVAAEVSVGRTATAAVAARMPAGPLAGRVRTVLGGLTHPTPHPKAVPVIVTRVLSAWSVAGPRVGAHACASEDDLVSLIEWVVVEELRASLAHLTQLHAAAARMGTHAVVAVGPSGAGKSSLALAWSRMGLPIYGDDVVLVDQVGRLHAFPRLGKVETSLARAHGVDPADTVEWATGAEEIWVDPARQGGWAEPTEATLVVRTQWQPGERFVITPLSPTAMLAELHHHVLSPTAAAWDALSHLVAAAETCTLTFSDARAAAAALAERAR